MDFLDKLVIPQPEGNMILLNFLQMIALSALLIYTGILFGSATLSVWFNRKARLTGSPKYTYMAKDLIDLITTNKMFAFGLGVVPFLAIIMIYMQLLHNTHAFVTKYLIFSFVLYNLSLVLIHIYQHTADLNYLFGLFKTKLNSEDNDKQTRDFLEFHKANDETHGRTGFWGVIVLAVSMLLFIGSLSLAVENWRWATTDSALEVVLSFSTLFKYLNFIAASLAVSSIAFLIKKYKWEEEPTFENAEYIEYAKKFNLSVALIFTLILPLFYVLNLLITPKSALSTSLFGLTLAGFIMIFLLVHFIYEMLRRNKFKYISIAFYLLIGVIAVSQAKEQLIFRQSNAEQVAQLSSDYDAYHEATLAAAGKTSQVISGEDIYKGKCMACHAFDKKLVGPAHKDVLPKYIDNPEALAKYVLNPTKINPAFPPMPSQGLKPKEAEAVAKYMIEHYGPELKK